MSNSLFLFAYNPNMPEEGQFIYHEKYPRFRAKVDGNDLVIVNKYDGDEAAYEGKLKRAKKWWYSFKNKL